MSTTLSQDIPRVEYDPSQPQAYISFRGATVLLDGTEVLRTRTIKRMAYMRDTFLWRLAVSRSVHVANAARLELAHRNLQRQP